MGATSVSVIMQYALAAMPKQLPFEQLKWAISWGLGFNVLMAICAAVLLLMITGRLTLLYKK